MRLLTGFTFLLLFTGILNASGQDSDIKVVKYSKTEIPVPSGYSANDEYSLKGPSFSAQWLYLTKEMVDAGIDKQIISQFENQIDFKKSSNIKFISNGGEFSGKMYQVNKNKEFKFRILAFGIVNDQPLVLNLGFKENPESIDLSDGLVKTFFVLTK